ncbi:MAG TPA: BTAD domain-containing putative transcriptional regulator [Actinophytocola sp.]|uniref:BTAD domain-containing putative transcriptional regulator n=1 Tax=Actinophytocola sp. TaxID=1872138 RepID=UPI002E061DEA|nr:BTAD domain-containing putative transcriptional regulator [Actinophytocola sp.]
MDFRLLGAVEAWSMQHRVDLGPPKQRFLLAVLALQINQLVPMERLVDLTWPHAPPPTAQHAIHVRISQLRAALAEEENGGGGIRILTRGSAYVLQADPMCVDTHRFRALVTQARACAGDAEKVVLYRRALGLWLGPPLADVAGPEVVDRLCAGLEETRLLALEDCLDAELRLGRHRIVVDELAELVRQHPYRQRLLGQLMLALHRAGRAPEALRAYQLARNRMIDELGLEPEAPLKQLETAILCSDPALELAEPQPGAVPNPRLPATNGHRPAIETVGLCRRFGHRTAVGDLDLTVHSGEILGVLGPPGAGKTTLVRLLSTLLAPTCGSFSIAGVPSSRPEEIRRKAGVLLGGARHPGHLTGHEFLTYQARLFGTRRRDASRLADRLLDEVGLTAHASARIAGYGRDLDQRLALGRALVNEPSVLLLDDPAAGLDPAAAGRMLDLVRRIGTERGATVLLTTPRVAEVERICGLMVLLNEGVIAGSGPVGSPGGELGREAR